MSRLFDKHVNDWHNCLSLERSVSGRGGNKLRTYRLFKNSFETEIYCKIALPFSHQSAFAKFRCGVAPLRIETGRFENLRIEERICCFCNDFIEDETHVLLNCPFYDDFRENLFNVAKSYTVDFMSSNNEENILFLFTNFKKT
jgi:hypothetical protein